MDNKQIVQVLNLLKLLFNKCLTLVKHMKNETFATFLSKHLHYIYELLNIYKHTEALQALFLFQGHDYMLFMENILEYWEYSKNWNRQGKTILTLNSAQLNWFCCLHRVDGEF